MTSTASIPPTPMASIPNPAAFGVCESEPIMKPPGYAYCSKMTWWRMPAPAFQKAMPYCRSEKGSVATSDKRRSSAHLGAGAFEKIVDLLVDGDGGGEILCGTMLGCDKMVDVHGGGCPNDERSLRS